MRRSRLNLLLSLGLLIVAVIAFLAAIQPGDTGLKAVLLGWFTAP